MTIPTVEELKVIADMVVRLTELRQRYCNHLSVENFASETFEALLSVYRGQSRPSIDYEREEQEQNKISMALSGGRFPGKAT